MAFNPTSIPSNWNPRTPADLPSKEQYLALRGEALNVVNSAFQRWKNVRGTADRNASEMQSQILALEQARNQNTNATGATGSRWDLDDNDQYIEDNVDLSDEGDAALIADTAPTPVRTPVRPHRQDRPDPPPPDRGGNPPVHEGQPPVPGAPGFWIINDFTSNTGGRATPESQRLWAAAQARQDDGSRWVRQDAEGSDARMSGTGGAIRLPYLKRVDDNGRVIETLSLQEVPRDQVPQDQRAPFDSRTIRYFKWPDNFVTAVTTNANIEAANNGEFDDSWQQNPNHGRNLGLGQPTVTSGSNLPPKGSTLPDATTLKTDLAIPSPEQAAKNNLDVKGIDTKDTREKSYEEWLAAMQGDAVQTASQRPAAHTGQDLVQGSPRQNANQLGGPDTLRNSRWADALNNRYYRQPWHVSTLRGIRGGGFAGQDYSGGQQYQMPIQTEEQRQMANIRNRDVQQSQRMIGRQQGFADTDLEQLKRRYEYQWRYVERLNEDEIQRRLRALEQGWMYDRMRYDAQIQRAQRSFFNVQEQFDIPVEKARIILKEANGDYATAALLAAVMGSNVPPADPMTALFYTALQQEMATLRETNPNASDAEILRFVNQYLARQGITTTMDATTETGRGFLAGLRRMFGRGN